MNTRSDLPSTLLDNLLTAVILVDGDFVVHYVNPAAEQLLGVSARRLLQNRFDLVVEYISLDLERLRTAQRQGQGFSDGEVTLVIDGDPKLVDLSVITISESPNHRILMELRKIDQQKRISQELQQHAQQLAARDLVRGLAHEIKNPLGGLRGATAGKGPARCQSKGIYGHHHCPGGSSAEPGRPFTRPPTPRTPPGA